MRLTHTEWIALEEQVATLAAAMPNIEKSAATQERDFLGTMHANVSVLAKRAAHCAHLLQLALDATRENT